MAKLVQMSIKPFTALFGGKPSVKKAFDPLTEMDPRKMGRMVKTGGGAPVIDEAKDKLG